MKNGGGHFAPELGGHFKLELGGQYDWNLQLTIPTLAIGAKYDTMDPEHMKWIANEVQNGRFLFCPNGSHLSQYDDQKNYFSGLIQFLKDVDNGNFKKH